MNANTRKAVKSGLFFVNDHRHSFAAVFSGPRTVCAVGRGSARHGALKHALHVFVALSLGLMSGGAGAQQYRTQVQEVPESRAEKATRQDLEQQLEQLEGDPYGRALTLQHLAGKSAEDGDYATARRYLQEAVQLEALSEPAMAEMRGNLAQLQAQAGDYDKVIETMAPLIERGADADAVPQQAWVALGNAYARTGQWDKAVEPLQRASDVGSRDEGLYRLQLAVYMQAKRFDAAAGALKELVRLAPDKKGYWMQLAAVQSKRDNHRGAVAALEVAQRRGMLATAGERMRLVRAYMKSGAPYDAASQLAAWMESGQVADNAANQRLLASAWTEAEEYARAIEPLSSAARATGDPQLYAQLGQLHMDLAEWRQAAEAFERAEARGGIGSGTGQLLLSLGLAYYQQTKTELAHRAFEKAQSYDSAASLAGQWVEFLKAKPPGLEPLAMQGLAGAGGSESTAPTAGDEASDIAAAPDEGKPSRPVPDAVPDTGDDRTPVGAVRAGNQAGTIPPWRGGLTPDRAPASFESGDRVVDPFAEEQPRFTITRDNLDQYRDLLSAGHEALFERYPDYRMPVYPSHRTAAYPEAIYKATLANQDRARLENPDTLEGARLGFPFRKPESGVEVLWNHRLRYRSNDIWVRSDEAVVTGDGIANRQRRTEQVLFGYANLSPPAGVDANIIAYYLMSLNRDGRRQGTVLAHETMDSNRRIWVSVPRAARLFRVPPVGYDNPRPSTDGLMFIDQIDMYNGNFDRYVWRLVGRREMIVPYNAYRLQDTGIDYDSLLQPGYPDPRHMRYERHRVWVVEATERSGSDHEFGKRVFYIDEDSWSILMVDNFDESGNIWRFQEGHAVQYYDLQLTYTGPTFIYDLKDGRYFATRLTNEAPGVYYNTGRYQAGDFRPAAVRRDMR